MNGFSGVGAPLLVEDEYNPSAFGFQEWCSVSNFFDRNPLMGRSGEKTRFEAFEGDSSEITVAEALKFIEHQAKAKQPFFAVVWFGSPHSPFAASEEDMAGFGPGVSREHHGEIVAMDRAVGTLRAGLRAAGVAENTLLWYSSDNGGLPGIKPDTVGGLRGNKNTLYEGGLRVPGILEWPAQVKPRVTEHPACTMDIFPTIVDLLGLPEDSLLTPRDGGSLAPLLAEEIGPRAKPIPFRHTGRGALVDNAYKLVVPKVGGDKYELYNLEKDAAETNDLFAAQPEIGQKMREAFEAWNETVEASVAGKDYPEGSVNSGQRGTSSWTGSELYKPYLEELRKRPEYGGRRGAK